MGPRGGGGGGGGSSVAVAGNRTSPFAPPRPGRRPLHVPACHEFAQKRGRVCKRVFECSSTNEAGRAGVCVCGGGGGQTAASRRRTVSGAAGGDRRGLRAGEFDTIKGTLGWGGSLQSSKARNSETASGGAAPRVASALRGLHQLCAGGLRGGFYRLLGRVNRAFRRAHAHAHTPRTRRHALTTPPPSRGLSYVPTRQTCHFSASRSPSQMCVRE